MRTSARSVCFLLFTVLTAVAAADGERDNNPLEVRRVPRAGVPVPVERETALRKQLTLLQSKIVALQAKEDAQTIGLLPDVLIFERAIRCALDYDEFFSPKDINKADAVVAEGIDRAQQLLSGKPEWPNQSGLVVRGYTSRIDHTVQPYGLVVPKTYAFNHSVPTRCDVWFHGRGETLSELNFIWDRMKNAGLYTPDHTIVLHPYGRYSNAFKFAGETDVLEALEDVQQRYRIDEDRISVRGFSMGGAACWQFAVHYPDRWFAANPGAGFSETPEFLKFFQKETLNPKPWEKALWNLYDCDKYALNLTHCPTIAYSGENDIQKQAADVMEAALIDRGIKLRHVIGLNMGHKIDHASKVVIEAGINSLAKRGRIDVPARLSFETHTLKYNSMHWVTVDAIDQHWKPARVEAALRLTDVYGTVGTNVVDLSEISDGRVPKRTDHFDLEVYVDNVTALSIQCKPGTFEPGAAVGSVEIIDRSGSRVTHSRPTHDDVFSDGSWSLQLVKDPKPNDTGEHKWRQRRSLDFTGLQKRHNLQGPIDDAFMDSFVFVRPTGAAANEMVGKWAESELKRAIVHWRRHFRGDARVVNDTDVTDELIQTTNLILWGDPASNSVLKKIADRLPLKWTTEAVRVGDKSYDAATHATILIYPNPLNPNRYVVLNSSFTYRDYAYLNNARQVPMLPDWAVIDLTTPAGNVWPGKVVAADFFDEQWRLKKPGVSR